MEKTQTVIQHLYEMGKNDLDQNHLEIPRIQETFGHYNSKQLLEFWLVFCNYQKRPPFEEFCESHQREDAYVGLLSVSGQGIAAGQDLHTPQSHDDQELYPPLSKSWQEISTRQIKCKH